MNVAGIIAEYNPFHNGHKFHLQATRQRTGCDYLAVVMSGSFVQRGEPAFADKFTRARWALSHGADIVLELPTVHALSSANGFAEFGVRMLAATNSVDALSFGCETPDVCALREAANATHDESEEFMAALRAELSSGKSYPRSIYEAAMRCGASERALTALSQANDTLALEYIRALDKHGRHILPVAINRLGAQHDCHEPCNGFASASHLRELLRTGAVDETALYLPSDVLAHYTAHSSTHCAYDEERLVSCLRYELLNRGTDYLASIAGVSEGIENTLMRAACSCSDLGSILKYCKSKRYTMARVRRSLMCVLLGITKDDVLTSRQHGPTYLRVLGVRAAAIPLLSHMCDSASVPLIVKRADAKALSAHALRILEIDSKAHAIRQLISPVSTEIAHDFSEKFTIV
ncbi:MAG: nucleotidyltransferase family protein [Clostridia bacterium]|nr:nucleotidyltransferase family protein [Clostridia bacterium]